MAFCHGCGKDVGEVATCPHCGAAQHSVYEVGAASLHAPSSAAAGGIGYFDVLKKYAVFNARARRKEYWMFFLINFLVSIAIGVVEGLMGWPQYISNLYSLVLLVPGIAVGVRRLHDTDRSGWWLLVPIANLVFLATDSTPGPNRFGPSPK
ncbi:DUF805 domain-containing protein [Pseudomonas sp. LP_7_YM]|uniref:DUF805 domain-containing protein n=1 Tax=Pseudomonas sp. LP_7_YM TaxID=2485137 RepID=UPI00105D5531|nr:DUF805 domain-containing protein [Pseudomonas sp. LP_7_YM]TDV66069.1 uncharacterized membrane protein YhaH (DUF805 family) [Pseudomonas sp. LP_7_YM]